VGWGTTKDGGIGENVLLRCVYYKELKGVARGDQKGSTRRIAEHQKGGGTHQVKRREGRAARSLRIVISTVAPFIVPMARRKGKGVKAGNGMRRIHAGGHPISPYLS